MKDYKIYKMEEIKSKDKEFSDDEFDDSKNVEDYDNFPDDEFDGEEFPDDELPDDEFDGEEFPDDESEIKVMSHKDIDDFASNDDDEFTDEDEFGHDEDDLSDKDEDEFTDDDEFGYDEGDLSDEDDLSDEIDDAETPPDSNYQGNIRNVPGAFLVYKRPAEDSTYEELWLYTIGNDIKDEMRMRRAILAGTDIKPQTGRSADNKQTVKVTSLGNVQYLNIFGIPN